MATILVVDDRPENREFLVTLLGYVGHRLLEAEDGAEALDIVRAERPDLVIVDLVMPTMDGYEFVRQVRADPAFAQTRVIFYTATYLQSEAWALAQASGVLHILTKPAEPEVVFKIVAEALALPDRSSQLVSSEEFQREHLRVITDKLFKQVEALEQEVEERKRAQEALQQEVKISTALARVGREIVSSLGTPLILERLCQLATEVLEADGSHTLFWQPAEDAYALVSSYGRSVEQETVTQGLTIPRTSIMDFLSRLEQEETVQMEMTAPPNPLLVELAQQHGAVVCLFMALRRGEELVGLQTAYRRRAEPFTAEQERIARGVAQTASLALAHAKLIEELGQAHRIKSDFLAAMSHELRTPLTVILGYTDLLLDGDFDPLTPGQSEKLRQVERNAAQLLELITATLAVSRLEVGQLPLELSLVNVHELMRELKEETGRRVHEKEDLSLTWRIAPELPLLRSDRTKLKMVIRNILDNAVKFTEKGSITVDVGTRDDGMEFCITDTGIGIAPEVQPIIFEMFRQGDSSTTRRYGGVGLGLYIMRRMLELLGGTVTVETEVGKGSTFRVWVPGVIQKTEKEQ